MTIYTRTGDEGTSDTLTGERLAKTDALFEAGGTIDELSAHVGVLRASLSDSKTAAVLALLLRRVQQDLIVLGAYVSSGDAAELAGLQLTPAHIEQLIDAVLARRPIDEFVIPGDNLVEAHCHVARTVCRRAERRLLSLSPSLPEGNPTRYINRLSDLFFALALWARAPFELQLPDAGAP